MTEFGWNYIVVAGLGLLAGILIGSLGVGGVILAPTLIELSLPSIKALPTCMFSYIFVGLAEAISYLIRNTISLFVCLPLLASVVPGAVFGAFLVRRISSFWLKVILYCLVFLSAVYSLVVSVRKSKQKAAQAGTTDPFSCNSSSTCDNVRCSACHKPVLNQILFCCTFKVGAVCKHSQ